LERGGTDYKNQQYKTFLTIIITAIIVGVASYYLQNIGLSKVKEELSDFANRPIDYIANRIQVNTTSSLSSEEYAIMGRTVLQTFSCVTLANGIDDPDERHRLDLFGYGQGKIFLTALNSNKVDVKDRGQEIPMAVLMLLNGPSFDFILGRIYEESDKDFREYLRTDTTNKPYDRYQYLLTKYQEQNCKLIGR
jgi:hypothetical protein